MHVILSSPILLEDGEYIRSTISQEMAQRWVNVNRPINYSQHQTTKILGVDPATARQNTPGYDEALIIAPKERLEFGREYSQDEIESIGVDFILITRVG
jgi:hypothetical protein